MAKDVYNSIGLMSGTSADGVSIAFCNIDFSKRKIDVIAFKNYSYSKVLQKRIMEIRGSSIEELSLLNYELGKLWAKNLIKFLNEFKINPDKIDVIGSHGQTVYHNSKLKNTFQIGEASFIAEAIKKTVVCDFRHQDIAAGGQGAPLVPFMDEFLFGNDKPVALQNIGGIGNISVVGKGVKTYGFDTGPGNSLMDWAVYLLSNGKLTYDRDGNWAKKGKIDKEKVFQLIKAKNNFFLKKPPKSLDREEFGKEFLIRNFKLSYEKRFDILATLNYFTAYTIAFSIKKYVKEKITRLIVSGGGALNTVLLKNLSDLLQDIKVISIKDYGIHPLAKEPAAFALLASATIAGISNNCPSVTGSSGKRVLGKIISPFGFNNL